MGKTRAKRGRAVRPSPTGKVENGGSIEDEGAGDAPGNVIANIVDQLKSASAEDRLNGCRTFSQLVSRELTLDVLRDHRLVRLAGPLLVDPCVSVRQAASGALRNLSLSGGKEGCDLMLEHDVLTPLMVAFSKCSEGWKPQRKVEKGQVLLDAESEIFVQITNLLWNLCEASDKAVAAVNKGNVCQTLLRCLDTAVYPAEVAVAVGQCLHALSEDNKAVAALARQQVALLRALVAAEGDSGDVVLLRVLALGILINISEDDSDARSGEVMTLITRTLAVDARDLACKVTSNAESEDYELQLGQLSLLLTAQQVALEILTDSCSGDDSSDGWTDQDSLENEDDMGEDGEEDADDLMEGDWRDDGEAPSLPAELHEALTGLGLLRTVVAKADTLPANVDDILQQTLAGQRLCRQFHTMRCRVFLCLNNLVLALELPELGDDAELVTLWRRTAQLVFGDAANVDAALLESAGAVMRAALQKLLDAGRPGPADVTAADLQRMASRAADCGDAAARAGLARGIGLLGCLRVKGRDSLAAADAELVQAIGQFLVELAASDPELPVVAEALDVLMDLYGEDCTDRAAAAIQLVGRLRALQPALKAKMSLQRQRLAEHFPLVSTVRTNLPRFIKYKAARLAALSNGSAAH